jgi:hypothetical protein
MLPVAAWLLWRQPGLRWPFVAMAAGVGALTLATGLTDEWLRELLTHGARMNEWLFNVGPSRFVGTWWLLAGIPLAAWLTWKGRIGLASLAMSPYLLPYYLMFGLLEDRRR